jgi:hypothetical protein
MPRFGPQEYPEIMRDTKCTLLRLPIISIALLICAACSKAQEQEIVTTSPPMAKPIHFLFAIYYLPLPSKDPSTALDQLLANERSELKLVQEMQEPPGELLVSAYVQDDVQNQYPPPDVEALQLFGRGLTREQAEGVQESEQHLLEFCTPRITPGRLAHG